MIDNDNVHKFYRQNFHVNKIEYLLVIYGCDSCRCLFGNEKKKFFLFFIQNHNKSHYICLPFDFRLLLYRIWVFSEWLIITKITTKTINNNSKCCDWKNQIITYTIIITITSSSSSSITTTDQQVCTNMQPFILYM